jgi:hypothetical protein
LNGNDFDRIARTLFGNLPRREAVRAVAGTGLAAVAGSLGFTEAISKKKKKKKPRCRKRLQQCGGKKKCCNKSGSIRCQELVKPSCNEFPGRRCCGQEGSPCDSSNLTCDCCGTLCCQGGVCQGFCP